MAIAHQSSPSAEIPPSTRSIARRTPRWDPIGRTLWFGTTLIKRFMVPARNQDLVLAAFEEQNWRAWIDDPLPPRNGVDPKHRLHNTLSRLNLNQRRRLIRFIGNGNGRGIGWELLPARGAKRRKRGPAASRKKRRSGSSRSRERI